MGLSLSDFLHCVVVVHVAVCDPPLSLTIVWGAESVGYGACILRSGVFVSSPIESIQIVDVTYSK
jgi:hypothetical protein